MNTDHQTDPFAGQWQDVRTVLATTTPIQEAPANAPAPATQETPTMTTPATEPPVDHRTNRLRARAAEKRTDRHDNIAVERERAAAAIEVERLRAENRAHLAAVKANAKAEKRTTRRQYLAERTSALRSMTKGALRRGMVTGPILFPMAVAWTGQAGFAMNVLGWWFAFAIVFAAAWELSTAFVAWMYHEARKDGDGGLKFRIATWIFAGGAALMNYWHAAGAGWNPTPKAVSFATMSVTGIVLWELYASLVHRKHLRAAGLVSSARPSIGAVRWIRYPVRSWTAWSLAILEGHQTLDAAWTAADAHLRSKGADRSARTAARRSARLDRADRTAAQRTARKEMDRTAKKDRTGIPGPVQTGRTERTALAARTAGPDRTTVRVDLAKTDRTTAVQTVQTVQQDNTAADRGPKTDRPARTTQRTATQTDRTARSAGPLDRTETDLVLNDTEQEAINLLRSTDRSISKRSIADVVRNELGRTIGSDRAAEIARHFRTLRSAA